MNPLRTPHSALRNLILIGYRGTGKTNVGRLLAQRWNWGFVDADDQIVARAGKTIADIFADEGEAAFRDLEQRVIVELCQREGAVVSLGGGAILRKENRDAIRSAGQVIWLTAAAETIFGRVTADEATAARRPNLTTAGGLAEIKELLAEREPLYAECANCRIDTDRLTMMEVVDKIMEVLPKEET